ncbi:MAG: hypothetical protein ACE5OZ_19605, partial [Candidatus Heimdallarchaeota archaeon]
MCFKSCSPNFSENTQDRQNLFTNALRVMLAYFRSYYTKDLRMGIAINSNSLIMLHFSLSEEYKSLFSAETSRMPLASELKKSYSAVVILPNFHQVDLFQFQDRFPL